MATHHCSRCGGTDHNARRCETRHHPDTVLPLIRASLPGWIAVTKRLNEAAQRVDELITPELKAAWEEQIAAMAASNEVGLAVDALIRSLPDPKREEIFAVLREEGFQGLAKAIGVEAVMA